MQILIFMIIMYVQVPYDDDRIRNGNFVSLSSVITIDRERERESKRRYTRAAIFFHSLLLLLLQRYFLPSALRRFIPPADDVSRTVMWESGSRGVASMGTPSTVP